MWAKDRHHRITSLLSVYEQVSLEHLAEEFGVSRETLRRDIVQLESQGLLRRVHGGIMRVEEGAEPPLQSRMSAHADAKRRIGAVAARLVEPGMLCAIDAGSTTLAFAAHLANVPDVTIVTNSLDIATILRSGKGNAQVVLVGGELGADVPATYGPIALAQMRKFVPQLAFFSPVAIDATRGAMNYDLAEAEFASAMAQSAQRVVVLADHSKLGAVNRIKVCDCSLVDTLITDRKATQEQVQALTAAGVRDVQRA